MKVEVEAKFLNVEFEGLRKKLKEAGARCVLPETKMVRAVFKDAFGQWEGKRAYARVRVEGPKTILTYKEYDDDNSLTGVRELNLEVSDFDTAVEFCRKVGLRQKSFEETRRELWDMDGVEVCLDTWPWIPSYVEIEAATEERFEWAVEVLGLDRDDAMYGAVDAVYARYFDVTKDEVNGGENGWGEIVFGDGQVPKWLEAKRRKK